MKREVQQWWAIIPPISWLNLSYQEKNKYNIIEFTRPHSRQVAHVYYQKLFDSKMAGGDQLWSVSKLENDLLRRNASTNGRKTDLIERYILHRKPKHTIYVRYFAILLYLLNECPSCPDWKWNIIKIMMTDQFEWSMCFCDRIQRQDQENLSYLMLSIII